jgi:NAD(P)-dependent dehydrogenase (short-subunit alcohol dehydrogenase family)
MSHAAQRQQRVQRVSATYPLSIVNTRQETRLKQGCCCCCCCCCCYPSLPTPPRFFRVSVNNVGTNIRKPSVEFSESDFSTIFSTNLESAFALSQQFHPLLKAAGSSVLLFNSSVAGECMTLQAGFELSRLCRLGGPGLQCADESAAGTMGAHGETVHHSTCGRGSQTSALASKPRAHEGARGA